MAMGDAPDLNNNLLCQSDGMGMIMYMEGFQWTLKGEGSCLNFFVGSWTLDTVPKFMAAMVCVVAMGIATEGIRRWKHDVGRAARSLGRNSNSNSGGGRLRVTHTCLQGLSILSAYLLMLVVMTYSLELLFCVILGLMIGYYVFDGDSLGHGGGTPCCSFLEGSDGGTQDGTSLTESLLPRTTTASFGGGINSNSNNNNNSNDDTIHAASSTDSLGNNGHSCCNDGIGSQNEEEGI